MITKNKIYSVNINIYFRNFRNILEKGQKLLTFILYDVLVLKENPLRNPVALQCRESCRNSFLSLKKQNTKQPPPGKNVRRAAAFVTGDID